MADPSRRGRRGAATEPSSAASDDAATRDRARGTVGSRAGKRGSAPERGPAEGSGEQPGDAPASPRAAEPHAAIVAEVRARFGAEPAGAAVAIYLGARGYDAAQVAEILARLARPEVAPGGPTDGARPGAAPAAGGPVAGGPVVGGPAAAGSAAGASVVTASGFAAAPAPPVRPLRAWAPHERGRFTAEAWGRLLELRAAGLGDHEFEHLVDRALLQLDGPVTLPELRALLGDALGPGEAGPPTLH